MPKSALSPAQKELFLGSRQASRSRAWVEAAQNIEALGIEDVSIIAGDGGEGYAAKAPYGRAIFTAGSYDLPRHFYEQLKDQALLLIVIKNEGGRDNLFLLCKTGNHFESLRLKPVRVRAIAKQVRDH